MSAPASIRTILLSLALFLFPALAHAAGTVGVMPMSIDLDLSAGQKGKFQIEVYSTSKEDAPVHLALSDAQQKEDGSLDFVEGGTTPFSCTNWIKFEKTDFIVPAGERVTIKAEILAPPGNAGSRLAAIMIEPGYEKKATGISVRVRYAVVLRLSIKGKSVMEQARIERVGVKKLEDGAPAVEIILANDSQTQFMVTGRVALLDAAGRSFANLNLSTAAQERKKAQEEKEKKEKKTKDKKGPKEEAGQRLYPGAKVAFLAKLDKPLPAGEYAAVLNLKCGKRSIRAKEKITLTEDDLAGLAQKARTSAALFEIRPPVLEVKSPAGGERSVSFMVVSLAEAPLNIRLAVKDIEYAVDGSATARDQGATPYTLADWITLEKTEYGIDPRRSQPVVLRIKVPDAALAGDRFGQIQIDAKGEGEGAGSNENNLVAIHLQVPGKVEPTAAVKKFEHTEGKDRSGFGLELNNTCPFQLIPKAAVTVRDQYNNEVERVELKLAAPAVLPQSSGQLRGEMKKKLIPGEYQASAEIDYGGKQKATAKLDFKVKE